MTLQWQMSRQLQLHANHVDQHGHRRAAGLQHKMRGVSVKRVTGIKKCPQSVQRVIDLQQGPPCIVAQASVHIFGC